MAENGSQVKKDDICQKWQEMDFRVFLVMAIEVEKRRSGKMVKMVKMGCRGYLVGNGFSRFLHHGHRGSQEDHDEKWQKMVENGRKKFTAVIW